MSLTASDGFCGAGGSSSGLARAGFDIKWAGNHWAKAIGTHALNFPNAEHACADLRNYDWRRTPSTDLGWFSPECTWHSPAGGRKRVRAQLDLLDDHVPDAAGERSRMTAFDVIAATQVHCYPVVIVENVVEMADWHLFDWWLDGLRQADERRGYHVQVVSVSAAHIGDETGNLRAPQWRDRIYVVATRGDLTPLDVSPRPLAHCPLCGLDVGAIQSWKNPRKRHIGKYGVQYVYRCPNATCRHAVVEPYVRPASSIINWSDRGVRIGDRAAHRKRPLAAATLRRIQAGLDLYGSIPATEQAHPFMFATNHGDTDGGRHFLPHQQPLPTRSTKIGEALVHTPFVAVLRRNATPSGIDEPLATMAAGGSHHGLVVPYYSRGTARPASHPLSTVTTKDRHAVVRPAVELEDCWFRMLQPPEQFLAQRFPVDHRVAHDVNKSEATCLAGNAVASNVSQWLGGIVAARLGGAA